MQTFDGQGWNCEEGGFADHKIEWGCSLETGSICWLDPVLNLDVFSRFLMQFLGWSSLSEMIIVLNILAE